MSSISKVPQVTAAFWIIKILTTGMGEALADYFDHTFDPILVVAASAVLLAAALWWQFKADRFIAARYWAAVSMVSVFGTLAADAVHVVLGVPYWVSSVGFFLALAIVFFVWRATEGSISISSITSVRRELFYWAVVMATFALGTAAGDMTAVTFAWGFFASGVIFAVAYALPLAVNRVLKRNSVLAFWAAYVITRPFGASFADWLALPADRGGIGWGTLPVSLVLIAAIALFVALNRRSAKA